MRVVAAFLLSGLVMAGCGSRAANPTAAKPSATTTNPCLPNGSCQPASFEELNRVNRRYADRMPFSGDSAKAEEFAARVRQNLSPLADSDAYAPPIEDVRRAVVAALPPNTSVGVTTSAFGLPGTAFGADVAGGCVFGSISQRTLNVEVGGYVNDGGCVALLGH